MRCRFQINISVFLNDKLLLDYMRILSKIVVYSMKRIDELFSLFFDCRIFKLMIITKCHKSEQTQNYMKT